mmetsp:Transcript_6728/g.6891  ORF Transcript_6728/g.6891 Transcript_6728/m.6891 type:complete len:103 (-) Transcript_6728:84-392(-)
MLCLAKVVGKRCIHLSSQRIAVFHSNLFEIGRCRIRYYTTGLNLDVGNATVFAGHKGNCFNDVANMKHSEGIIGGRNIVKRWGSGGASTRNARTVDLGHLRP